MDTYTNPQPLSPEELCEKHNLKPLSVENEKFGITMDDVNEDDEIMLVEVCRKDGFILYECEDENMGSDVSDETINELFPDFEIHPMKSYMLEKDGEFYFQ
jgi:hypothetical protein